MVPVFHVRQLGMLGRELKVGRNNNGPRRGRAYPTIGWISI